MRSSYLALVLLFLAGTTVWSMSAGAESVRPAATGTDAVDQSSGPEIPRESAIEVRDDQLLVLLIYDESCIKACATVRPIVKSLSAKDERLKYVELDASKSQLKDSLKTAKALGVSCFFADSSDIVPILGVFSGKKRRLLYELQGTKSKEVYEAALSRCLTRASKQCK